MKRQFEESRFADHMRMEVFNRNEDGSYRVEYYHNNGNIQFLEFYDNDDQLHRSDGPAYSKFRENGRLINCTWYNHGQKTRMEDYYSNGLLEKQAFYNMSGQLDRDRREGPAYSEFHESGKRKKFVWYDNGRISRNGCPAQLEFDKEGKLREENWFINGFECNRGERYPIHIEYNKKGQVTYEKYKRGGGYREIYYKNNKPIKKYLIIASYESEERGGKNWLVNTVFKRINTFS